VTIKSGVVVDRIERVGERDGYGVISKRGVDVALATPVTEAVLVPEDVIV
jgi:hypothetical protein